MAITKSQYQDYLQKVITPDVVDLAIDWMRINLKPEDVFSEEQLLEWYQSTRIKPNDD